VTSVGVALPDNAEVARSLVDRASELAQRLNGRWVAFVICNDALPSLRARNALEQAELAMRSGGTVYMCEGEDVAETLLALAAREQIDVLILGAPTDPDCCVDSVPGLSIVSFALRVRSTSWSSAMGSEREPTR